MNTTPHQLADELLQAVLDAYPVSATLLGIRDRDDRLPDHTEAGEDAYAARLRDIVARADQADGADWITRAVVRDLASGDLDQLSTRATEYTIAPMFFAPAFRLLSFLPQISLPEPAQADGYLARLAGLPEALAAIAERHRAGIAAGRLPVRPLVQAAVDQLDRRLSSPEQDPLRRPEPPGDRAAFQAERDRLLTALVHPAVKRYRDVLAVEVAPHARPAEKPGLCWLPEGEAYYAALVRHHTTTRRTPEELHRTGLEIIAQLEAEYAEIGARLLGTSDPAEIRDRLRTDPALRWRDGEELLAHARATIARAETVAPAWFGRLPSQSCVVAAVPAAEAVDGPGAYYLQPALDGSRPGTYFANTHAASERGRATYEAVAFHEGVPGHHFQLTLMQELTDLPLLRRVMDFNAYTEGWGLYAERLADEMGLYSSDLDRLGMLSEDSMRAARLVVDTGLHAMGWSRQRVVDYLRAYTANPEVEIQTETDRYIAGPGQALSYMVGRLEIQRLRRHAKEALGERFDIRAFHDTVLGHGALPLGVLEQVVRQSPPAAA